MFRIANDAAMDQRDEF